MDINIIFIILSDAFILSYVLDNSWLSYFQL